MRTKHVSENTKHAGSWLIGAAALVTAFASWQAQPDEQAATDRQRKSYEVLSAQLDSVTETQKQMAADQREMREWNASLRGYLNALQGRSVSNGATHRTPRSHRRPAPEPPPTAVRVLPPPPKPKATPKIGELPTFEAIEQQVQAQ